MKWNREKVTALLALLLGIGGVVSIGQSVVARSRQHELPDITLTTVARTVVARKHRTFVEEGSPSREPFSFSEGWARLESIPIALPPPPAASCLVPLLGAGPGPLESGFIFQDPPTALAEEGETP